MVVVVVLVLAMMVVVAVGDTGTKCEQFENVVGARE